MTHLARLQSKLPYVKYDMFRIIENYVIMNLLQTTLNHISPILKKQSTYPWSLGNLQFFVSASNHILVEDAEKRQVDGEILALCSNPLSQSYMLSNEEKTLNNIRNKNIPLGAKIHPLKALADFQGPQLVTSTDATWWVMIICNCSYRASTYSPWVQHKCKQNSHRVNIQKEAYNISLALSGT